MYPTVHNSNVEKRSSETLGLAQAFSAADSDIQELEGTFPPNAARQCGRGNKTPGMSPSEEEAGK